ncbi:MAG TPA: oligosaccharide flippase family protein [Gammaproteobacteria bacterium]|nr:oligosaccharide flippase family protein [Gammaproteobacteria bacterium]
MLSFGAVARNTLWMTLGQGIRTLVQAVYFVLIARILHRDGYGAFSGVVALVAVLLPFSGWGGGNLLIKHVARDKRLFSVYWGRTLFMSCASAGALVLLATALGWWILPASVPSAILFWVAISDLLFARLLEASGQAFQAFHQLFKTAFLWVALSVARLGAVLLLIHVHAADDLLTWSLLYMCSTAAVTIPACLWVSFELGLPRWDMSGWRAEFGEGFYFASSVSAQRIYLESDKTLLTRLSTLESAGTYAAAARIVDVAFVPVNALLAATYVRFFVQGREGVQGTLRLSKQLLPIALGYALTAGAVLFVLAPLVPRLLGTEFMETVPAIRWLAIMPTLMTLHRFAADSLTGAGWQGTRTSFEFLVAVFNIVLNLCLVPYYSWRGAALAACVTGVTLVFALALALRSIAGRAAPTANSTAAD